MLWKMMSLKRWSIKWYMLVKSGMKICKEWTLIVDNLKTIFMKDIMQQQYKNKLRNWILLNTLMNSMQVIYKS